MNARPVPCVQVRECQLLHRLWRVLRRQRPETNLSAPRAVNACVLFRFSEPQTQSLRFQTHSDGALLCRQQGDRIYLKGNAALYAIAELFLEGV